VLHVCPECGNGRQQATGGLVPVGPDVTRMARCDAQHIGPLADRSATPANDLQPDDSRGEPESTPDRAAAVQGDAHVSANESSQTSHPQAGTRAQQTIPPALRRAVLLRDQRRCQVPGCTNARWLDVHHIELRSEGGRHSLENLTCLCSAHHRATHRGKIALTRSESGALRVRHADGTEYGRPVRPQVLEVCAKVFSASASAKHRSVLRSSSCSASRRWTRLPLLACCAKPWPGCARRACGADCFTKQSRTRWSMVWRSPNDDQVPDPPRGRPCVLGRPPRGQWLVFDLGMGSEEKAPFPAPPSCPSPWERQATLHC
jgi:HNH endonuclease